MKRKPLRSPSGFQEARLRQNRLLSIVCTGLAVAGLLTIRGASGQSRLPQVRSGLQPEKRTISLPVRPRGLMNADHHVPSRPENLVWGWFPLDGKPVVTVKSGETVRIDTISHQGATQDEDPVSFLGKLGVKPEEILRMRAISGLREAVARAIRAGT